MEKESFWFSANMILQRNVRILAINNQLFYVFSYRSIATRYRSTHTHLHISTIVIFFLIFLPYRFFCHFLSLSAPTFLWLSMFASNKHFFVFLLQLVYVNKTVERKHMHNTWCHRYITRQDVHIAWANVYLVRNFSHRLLTLRLTRFRQENHITLTYNYVLYLVVCCIMLMNGKSLYISSFAMRLELLARSLSHSLTVCSSTKTTIITTTTTSVRKAKRRRKEN